jgi:hypothetical protein
MRAKRFDARIEQRPLNESITNIQGFHRPAVIVEKGCHRARIKAHGGRSATGCDPAVANSKAFAA